MAEEEDTFNKIVNLPFMKGKKTTLEDALDLPPLVQDKVQVPVREDGDDYQTARQTIHEALGTLKTAINEMSGFAYQAQHPRGYEVLGGLVGQLVETAEKLIDVKNKAEVVPGPKTVNNTLNISSSDMLNMLKDKKGPFDENV